MHVTCSGLSSMSSSSVPKSRVALVPALALFVACRTGKSTTNDVSPAQPGAASSGAPTGAAAPPSSSGQSATHGNVDDLDAGPPRVQLIGRFDERDPAGPSCAWPGCRVIARFSGTSVAVRLRERDEAWMDGNPSQWDVAIDGQWRPKLVMPIDGDQTFELARDLPDGEHTVELYKRSEAQDGVTQFLGFDFGAGTLLPPPLRSRRRIEIIGDSAAAGFGIEGVGLGPDCPGNDWSAEWENFHLSFGALLGQTFDAELAGTVYSGKGMAKNIWHPDKETMPVIYARANPNDPTSTWDYGKFVPDVVVMMIGGNDFAIGKPEDQGPATLGQFTDAYDDFVAGLREKYPRALVFLTASPSATDDNPPGRETRTNVLAGLQSVLARRHAAGDTQVYGFSPQLAPPEELRACNGHGTPEFHRRVADEIAVEVKRRTGW